MSPARSRRPAGRRAASSAPGRMQVLAFVNQKGGCGKTTTAVNLAGALAASGERVLLVDLDPQAHATMALGCAVIDEPSVAEVLLDEVFIEQAIQPAVLDEALGNLDLLPGHRRLSEFDEAAERLIHPDQRLKVSLDVVRDRYDWVLVDCPPRAEGALCANALFASTCAVLVVETGAFALQGALQALQVLDEVGEGQGRRYEVRVVGTLFDRRTRFARELLVALHARFGEAMFDTVIRTSVRLREAPAVGLPVQVLDPSCRATADFAALAEEVVSTLGAIERPRALLQAGARSENEETSPTFTG